MSRVEGAPGSREYAEQVLSDTQAILRDAVGIVLPENPEADPRTVFPNPNVPLRAEGEEPMELTDEQKEQLISKAGELGFGRAEDVGLSEQGLQGSIVVIEGGQPHKMMAEALIVANDPNAGLLRAIVVAASGQRVVGSPAEIESAVHLFGGNQTGKTELDMARQVLRELPDFRDPKDDEVQGDTGIQYDIDDNYRVSTSLRWFNGQLVRVGYLDEDDNAIPVTLLRVDREDYTDESDRPRYRNQPNTADLIGIVDDAFMMQQSLDDYKNRPPITLVTSGLYRPSRAVLTALAGLRTRGGIMDGRHVGLATYGNDLLNEVRGTDLPPDAKQLPGELQYMAEKVVELEVALKASKAR